MSARDAHRSLLALAVVLFAATPAAADASAWRNMILAGVTGTWAVSCSKPMGKANPFFTYYGDIDGPTGFLMERGRNFPALHTAIDDARLLSPSLLRVDILLDDRAWGRQRGDRRQVWLELLDGNRLRTLASIDLTSGKPLIVDRKVLQTGEPTYVEERCARHPRT